MSNTDMSNTDMMPYGDPFNYHPDMDEAMRKHVARGLGLDIEHVTNTTEAPHGPADAIQTKTIQLAPTIGGAALEDYEETEI